jgi:hypothetical protein
VTETTTIAAYAQFLLDYLRLAGCPDADILAYTMPHTTADAEFETGQITTHGAVVAPAALVKAEMRRRVTH